MADSNLALSLILQLERPYTECMTVLSATELQWDFSRESYSLNPLKATHLYLDGLFAKGTFMGNANSYEYIEEDDNLPERVQELLDDEYNHAASYVGLDGTL